MRTFSQLKGMPVFQLPGKRLGVICDFALNSDGCLAGILFHRPSLFKKTAYIKFDDVKAFGSAGVIVEKGRFLNKVPEDTLQFGQDRLYGRMLLSDSGEELGLLHDVYFLEKMGTLVAYETTDGFFSELKEGKQLVRSEQPPMLGEDAIIVSICEQ